VGGQTALTGRPGHVWRLIVDWCDDALERVAAFFVVACVRLTHLVSFYHICVTLMHLC
jgi:hypothetical protein